MDASAAVKSGKASEGIQKLSTKQYMKSGGKYKRLKITPT